MSNMKAYRFIWRNPFYGITDQNGTTTWHPEKMVVIATSKQEAEKIFKKYRNNQKQRLFKNTRDPKEASVPKALVATIFALADLTVEEFELKHGLVV